MKSSWRTKLFKNIRFRGKMILVFVIGGVIPFFCVTVYLNNRTANSLIEQNKKAQKQELHLMASILEDVVPDMEKVCENMNINTVLSNMITKDYTDEKKWQKDKGKLWEIDRYMQDYKQSISDIVIYVSNETLCYDRPFTYLGPSVTQQSWYSDVCDKKGGLIWCYGEDREEKQKCIQVAKQIISADGEQLGILAVQMNMDLINSAIAEREENTVLLYNDVNVLYTNYEVSGTEELALETYLRGTTRWTGNTRFSVIGKDRFVTYKKVHPQNTTNYYSLVSVQDYSGITEQINQVTFNAYLIVGIGMLISFAMIIGYSTSFSSRLKELRHQMHLVATGRYDRVKMVGGNDEIGEIYAELGTMMDDIQNLTESMVEEKVQKEKMHTRQKEVEFKMLASQINPHFLYNTLETIRMKARVNHQPEIEDLVKMLAKIMRRNIQVSHKLVSLQSEIELIDNYMRIQDYRFGDRIHSEIVVDDDVDMTQEVMPLIIQPFVENAFIHGLENKPKDGRLEVKVSQDEKDIIIEVIDNGTGMNYYQLGELRHSLTQTDGSRGHIGISNVNQRLIMQYGKEYAVKVDSRLNEGTVVTIRIPKNASTAIERSDEQELP